MNKLKAKTDSQKLADTVSLARHQLAQAKNKVERAKERARLAKRRRKEAKQAFRQARKDVKRAKVDLAEAEQLLENAEAKLAQAAKPLASKRVKAKETVQVPVNKTQPRRVVNRREAAPKKQVVTEAKGGSGPAEPSAGRGSAMQSTSASPEDTAPPAP
jgi:hypothetical protein